MSNVYYITMTFLFNGKTQQKPVLKSRMDGRSTKIASINEWNECHFTRNRYCKNPLVIYLKLVDTFIIQLKIRQFFFIFILYNSKSFRNFFYSIFLVLHFFHLFFFYCDRPANFSLHPSIKANRRSTRSGKGQKPCRGPSSLTSVCRNLKWPITFHTTHHYHTEHCSRTIKRQLYISNTVFRDRNMGNCC